MSCALVVGCSASSDPGQDATGPTASGPSAVQRYLDAVNALCDELLPKVVAVTNGGSFDIPRGQFFAQLPEHQRLRDEFDHDLALIPVPAAARDEAAALDAYVRFANELDGRRLAAARAGPSAYQREIRRELRTAADDPSIAARTAAGFHESCNAR
jgi:hypothetical protein